MAVELRGLHHGHSSQRRDHRVQLEHGDTGVQRAPHAAESVGNEYIRASPFDTGRPHNTKCW